MIGRHHHHHAGSHILGATAASSADGGTVVRGRHDHGETAAHMAKDRPGKRLSLLVRKHELLREIRENTQSIRSSFDHKVDTTKLAFEIEAPILVKDRRHDRKDALQTGSLIVCARFGVLHGTLRVRYVWTCFAFVEPSGEDLQVRLKAPSYAAGPIAYRRWRHEPLVPAPGPCPASAVPLHP